MSQQFKSLREHRAATYQSYCQTRISKSGSHRVPSAFEKFRQRDYFGDKEYLAWIANSLTAMDTNPPQTKQLDPKTAGQPGGTQELGQRVFTWMGDAQYDASFLPSR